MAQRICTPASTHAHSSCSSEQQSAQIFSNIDIMCCCTDNQCNPVGANSCCKVAATLSKGTRVNALCWVPGGCKAGCQHDDAHSC